MEPASHGSRQACYVKSHSNTVRSMASSLHTGCTLLLQKARLALSTLQTSRKTGPWLILKQNPDDMQA